MRTVSALIVLALLFGSSPASASPDKGPNAEETAAYIAAKLESCGRFTWGPDIPMRARSVIQGPAISMVTTIFEQTGPAVSRIHRFDIRDIHKVEYVGSIVDPDGRGRPVALPQLNFYCRESERCIAVHEDGSDIRMELAGVSVCDADTGERLGRAFRHLMKITGNGKKMKELF